MKQRPIPGQEPLAPPTAEVARAYLDEIGLVHARREERIDRRALAWLSAVNAVVISVYVGIACFSVGVTQANSSFLIVLAVFLLWLQLSTEYRETHGAGGSPLTRSRAISIGLVTAMVVLLVCGIVVSIAGVNLPAIVRLIPAFAALLIVGVPAARELSGSVSIEVLSDRRKLLRPEKWATIGMGIVLAASIWVLTVGDFLLISIFAATLMVSYLAWWIAGRVTERLPALGAVWARPHWLVFGLACAVVTAIIVIQFAGITTITGLHGSIAAVIVIVLFFGAAFLDGRDG